VFLLSRNFPHRLQEIFRIEEVLLFSFFLSINIFNINNININVYASLSIPAKTTIKLLVLLIVTLMAATTATTTTAATNATCIPEFFNAIRGSLWGMFAADALSMPVHWYYDVGAIDSEFGLITDYKPPGGLVFRSSSLSELPMLISPSSS